MEAIKNQNLRIAHNRPEEDERMHTITADDVATFTFERIN